MLAYRWRAQQLDQPSAGKVQPTAVAILDVGVQDGAHQAARLALLNRGVEVDAAVAVMTDEALAPALQTYCHRAGACTPSRCC